MNEQELNVSEARDHLAMVDRILSRQEPPCLGGTPFIIWGIVGGGIDIIAQIVVSQKGSPSLMLIGGALILAAVAFMIWYSIGMAKKERRGLLDRHIGHVFMISWIVSFSVVYLAHHIFMNWAQGAVWSLMFGAAMMYAGTLTRSRIAFAGGIVLILSIIAANYAYDYAGYVLAAGFFVGMGGAGIVLTLARGNE